MGEISCEHFRTSSPENPECDWCDGFQINLDRAGRICKRCRGNDGFKRQLARLRQVRFGGCAGASAYCEVFQIATDEEQCRQCQSDPMFRAFLHGQNVASPKVRRDGVCIYRGEVLRAEEVSCCGGSKKRVEVYVCKLKGEATSGSCAECGDFIVSKEADRNLS